MGNLIANGLRWMRRDVEGPLGRGEVPTADVVLLCVPDSEIEAACEVVAGHAAMVGHTSGATPLGALSAAAEQGAEIFGLHPLQTVSGHSLDHLEGAGCAIAGSSPAALAMAREIASDVGMETFVLEDEHRAAYHAAASIASNYLLTLMAAAEAVAASAGMDGDEVRRIFDSLVRRTVENWAAYGPAAALTGPIKRGDEETVARQREAVRAASPADLEMWEALTERTRDLARVPA
jgi:predicted short-subunit dehydrogenase-like oxidoreductase (DUF2520 family)